MNHTCNASCARETQCDVLFVTPGVRASAAANESRGAPRTPIWQHNYYEHIVRNADELHSIRQYIVNNPLQWALDRENPAVAGVGAQHAAPLRDDIDDLLDGIQPLANELPYVSLEHVESNTGRILKAGLVGSGGEGKGTSFAFDPRHVLYGKLRPYLNKVALPDFQAAAQPN